MAQFCNLLSKKHWVPNCSLLLCSTVITILEVVALRKLWHVAHCGASDISLAVCVFVPRVADGVTALTGTSSILTLQHDAVFYSDHN